jgi:hypothetical protein
MEESNLCANCSGVAVVSVYFELAGFAATSRLDSGALTDHTDSWWCSDTCGRGEKARSAPLRARIFWPPRRKFLPDEADFSDLSDTAYALAGVRACRTGPGFLGNCRPGWLGLWTSPGLVDTSSSYLEIGKEVFDGEEKAAFW